jgi:hypothetical protein
VSSAITDSTPTRAQPILQISIQENKSKESWNREKSTFCLLNLRASVTVVAKQDINLCNVNSRTSQKLSRQSTKYSKLTHKLARMTRKLNSHNHHWCLKSNRINKTQQGGQECITSFSKWII